MNDTRAAAKNSTASFELEKNHQVGEEKKDSSTFQLDDFLPAVKLQGPPTGSLSTKISPDIIVVQSNRDAMQPTAFLEENAAKI